VRMPRMEYEEFNRLKFDGTTCKPGTVSKASSRVVAPMSSMSAAVITVAIAGALLIDLGVPVAMVISTSINSSRLISRSVPTVGGSEGLPARVGTGKERRSARKTARYWTEKFLSLVLYTQPIGAPLCIYTYSEDDQLVI